MPRVELVLISLHRGSEICPQPFSFRMGLIGPSSARSSQLESESLTVLSAILKNLSRDTADIMDRRTTPTWHW